MLTFWFSYNFLPKVQIWHECAAHAKNHKNLCVEVCARTVPVENCKYLQKYERMCEAAIFIFY